MKTTTHIARALSARTPAAFKAEVVEVAARVLEWDTTDRMGALAGALSRQPLRLYNKRGQLVERVATAREQQQILRAVRPIVR